MYTLNYLIFKSNNIQTEINGKWVPARPYVDQFTWRIKDAWRVLTGKADAFTWPEGQ